MSNIAVLDSTTHRNVRVDRRPSAASGDNQRFVQVILKEFPLLSNQYPILLSKNSDTGAFFCGAMLGFDEGENLFLKNGNHEGYRPLNLQRAPFYYAENDRLALDLDNPKVNAGEGETLFQPDGQPTEYLKYIFLIIKELRSGIIQTNAFIETILEHKLLTSVEFELNFDDGNQLKLKDLYTIRESALAQLSDEIIAEFFRNGYLYAIHLILASTNQISHLARRKNQHITEGSSNLVNSGGLF